MAKKDIDMLNGSLYKSVIRFTLPIIATNLFSKMFHVTDLFVIGRFCKSEAVGAVGATGSIVGLMISLFLGISTACGIVIAQSRGSKNADDTKRAVHTTVAMAIISGLLLSAIGVPAARSVLALMNTPSDILPMSAIYLRIYLSGMVFRMLYVFSSAILRALGDTKTPFKYLTLGGILNVIFNIFFVTVCNMDVDGVAYGTIISEGVSGIMCVLTLAKRRDEAKFTIKGIKKYFSLSTLKESVRIGLPAGVETSMFSISNVIVQSSINTFGSAIVTGNTAAASICDFAYLAISSFGVTASNFMAQNWGAKKYDRIKKLPKACLAGSFAAFLIGSGLLFIFARPLIEVYLKNGSSAVVDVGVLKMRIMLAGQSLIAILTVYTGFLRGLGKSFVPMLISVVGVCGVRILWVKLMLKIIYKPVIIFVGFPISYAVTAVATMIYYYYIIKRIKNHHAFKESSEEKQTVYSD